MTNSLAVWTEPTGSVVPKSESAPDVIVTAALGLAVRERRQIVSAFSSESYEMVSGFVLGKALAQLKKQLSTLGMEFVGEMLGRQDIDEDSVPTSSISNFEAIRLAQDLGIIGSTDAMRLVHQTELIAHFDSLNPQDAETEEMSKEEAIGFLRTCVNAVLGRIDNVAPTEFVEFRAALESNTFKANDTSIQALLAAPYFFKRTTLSILLSNVKTKTSAQYEHTLGNIVVIVPTIWHQLRDAEKWAIGQSYAEAVNAGRTPAVTAMKKALMAIQGFDYVPETLRSQTFSAAASSIINVHMEANNYYNEPAAVSALVKLGSTIPWPAFPICMSSIFAVYLGNRYGNTWAAESDVLSLMKRLTVNQWQYYFNECLPNDQMILQKLAIHDKPLDRWLNIFKTFDFSSVPLKEKEVQRIVKASLDGKRSTISATAKKMIDSSRIGR